MTTLANAALALGFAACLFLTGACVGVCLRVGLQAVIAIGFAACLLFAGACVGVFIAWE